MKTKWNFITFKHVCVGERQIKWILLTGKKKRVWLVITVCINASMHLEGLDYDLG